ncbi:MAG: hypothetical protein KAW12_28750 [Candidatus Aminicenantes bacterium]|nr:hypothetical protein [Candidatus Aminicenantes bacterium]
MKIKNLIFNNFGLKVTAIFFALAVWIIIAGKEHAHSEKSFEVNVEFINAATNIDANPRPEKVRVKVRGTSREINNISPEDFKLKIDLTGISQGTIWNLLSEDFLQIPGGLDYDEISIHPRMIAVTVKEFLWKEVSVRIRYKGRMKRGLRLIRQVVPEKVMIYGYKSRIASIDTVYATESIDLSQVVESKTVKLPLQKREEILKFGETEEVEVQLVVEDRNKGKSNK